MRKPINIQVDLSRLEVAVKKMGTAIQPFDLGNSESDIAIELERAEGVEIKLEDLEVKQGLLHYKDMQIVLFIPDHSRKRGLFEDAVNNGSKGHKFHIGDCKKLENMKRENKFDRYAVSRNPDGNFKIYGLTSRGNEIRAVVRLNVCQFCLGLLNYKGARESSQHRWQVAQEFDINEFFASYSSLFKELPRSTDNRKIGYSDDWKEISARTRNQANYTCQSCKVNLSGQKNLLHVHHINGIKSDNTYANLSVLCADCHRKQPCHDCMHVSHENIQLINQLRREQGITNSPLTWDEAFKYADPAVHGVLSHSQRLGYMVPFIAYELTDRHGHHISDLEVAWTNIKEGIYITKPAVVPPGWKLFSIEEALHQTKGLHSQHQLPF